MCQTEISGELEISRIVVKVTQNEKWCWELFRYRKKIKKRKKKVNHRIKKRKRSKKASEIIHIQAKIRPVMKDKKKPSLIRKENIEKDKNDRQKNFWFGRMKNM